MGLSFGAKIVKFLIFLFTFTLFLVGAGVFSIGIISRVKHDSFGEHFSKSALIIGANILIAVGFVLIVVGFMGCCGACRESKAMLKMYVTILFFIFALEIAGGAYAYTKKAEVEESLMKIIKISLQQFGNNTIASKSVNHFQKKIKCCGAKGPSDWADTPYVRNATKYNSTHSIEVPKSCCYSNSTDCNTSTKGEYYKKGCIEEGSRFVKENLVFFLKVIIAVVSVEAVNMLMAMCLICSLKKGKKK